MASSSERVFLNPKLLLHILSFLVRFRKSLRAAILVNRQWFECGIEVLWRYPSPCLLLKVAEDRRQIYASHARIIQLPCMPKEKYAELAELDFPKLDALWLVDGCCYNQHVKRILGKSLRTIFLSDAPLASILLDSISSRCANLSKVTFCRGKSNTTAAFIRFIRACPSLNNVEIVEMTPPKTGNKMLRYLGSHYSMRQLLFYSSKAPLRRGPFDAIMNTTPTPFKDLNYFRVTVLPDAIPSMVKCITSVQTLEIFCRGNSNGNLRYLSTLTALRHLDIMLPASSVPSASEIVPLRKLNLLEDLSVRSYEEEWDSMDSDFTRSHFDKLLSGLPKLRRLELSFPYDPSADAMAILSRCCPRLESCISTSIVWLKLGEIFSLYDEAEGPMFPHLIKLKVGLFLDPWVLTDAAKPESAATFALLVQKHCPKLRSIKYLAPSTIWHNAFEDAIDELVGEESPDDSFEAPCCPNGCHHGVDNPFG